MKTDWDQIARDLDNVDMRIHMDAVSVIESLAPHVSGGVDYEGIHEDSVKYAILRLQKHLSAASEEDKRVIARAIDALEAELQALKRGKHAKFPGALLGETKQEDLKMRKRMTRRGRRSADITAHDVLAEIDALEKRIAGEDAQLEADATAIAEQDAAIAEESTGIKVDVGVDQDAKANDNWPVSDRETVASSLVRMARELLEDQ